MANRYCNLIAILLISVLFNSCNQKKKVIPIANYLRAQSIKLTDTTDVIVMGCVACSVRPFDELDSILNNDVIKRKNLIFITTGLDQNIGARIKEKLKVTSTVRVITDTETNMQQFGLYHKNPKLYILTKEYTLVLSRVIKH